MTPPIKKLFYKIGEVCDLCEIQPHVLRYWETEFSMLSPSKNSSGQRIYRHRDVEIIRAIKQLLYEEGYTIVGANKKLSSDFRIGDGASESDEDLDRLFVNSDSGARVASVSAPQGTAPTMTAASAAVAPPQAMRVVERRVESPAPVAAAPVPSVTVTPPPAPAKPPEIIRDLRRQIKDVLKVLDKD